MRRLMLPVATAVMLVGWAATPAFTWQVVPAVTELKGGDGSVFGLAWSPDGQTLASEGYQQVNLWRLDAATPIRTFILRARRNLARRRQ